LDFAALAGLHPHVVVYDEAHKLKNSKSKQYEAALALPTKYRYGLSGSTNTATASAARLVVGHESAVPAKRIQLGLDIYPTKSKVVME
jgi:hypothetical protein